MSKKTKKPTNKARNTNRRKRGCGDGRERQGGKEWGGTGKGGLVGGFGVCGAMAKWRTGKAGHEQIGDDGVVAGKLRKSGGDAGKCGKVRIVGAAANRRNGGRADVGVMGDLALADAGVINEGVNALRVCGFVGVKD